MSAQAGSAREENFVPEKFCDEVYDYVDDNLAEAMDDMEKELLKATTKAARAGGASVENSSGNSCSVEETVKICCDHVQKKIQNMFDKNLDLFDRYVKKHASREAEAARAVGANTAAGMEPGGKGGGPSCESSAGDAGVAGVESPSTSRAGARDRNGAISTPIKKGRSRESSGFEVEERAAPKRLEEEIALDAEIQRLRKRRREGLKRCVAMVRKSARDKTVLQDVNDYVEALQMGVSNSFDDNGLTPVPAKVQEAVQSSAALRVTANRAQELTKRLERDAQERATMGAGERGGRSASAITVAPPRDVQSMFQRSNEQQSGGATGDATLEAMLRG